MGGKSSSPSATQTTTTRPFEEQIPFLLRGFQEAQNLLNTPGPQFFPGSTVAPLPQASAQGQQSLLNFAGGALPQQIGQTQQALGFGLNAGPGGVLDVRNDPVLLQSIGAAIEPTFRNLREDILPGLRSEAVLSGNVGSSREGIAQAQGVQRATESALNTTAGLLNDRFNRGLQTFERSLALSPSIAQLGALPGQLQSGVGQQQFAFNQALLDDQIARHNFEQNLQRGKVADFINMVSGSFGGSSVTEAQGAGGRGSTGLGLLGGALTGAQLGNTIFGPAGGLAGAGIGMLLGFL